MPAALAPATQEAASIAEYQAQQLALVMMGGEGQQEDV